jgi:hypothetical protein
MRCKSISLDIRVRAHRCGLGMNEMTAFEVLRRSCKNTVQSTVDGSVEHIVIVGKLSDSAQVTQARLLRRLLVARTRVDTSHNSNSRYILPVIPVIVVQKIRSL